MLQQKQADHDFSLQAVPQASRHGFWRILFVMLGFTFFSASMWAGGTLGTGMAFPQFLLVVLTGNLILGLYTGALAYIAAATGLSTHLLTRYAFGEKGSYFTSFLLSATQVGWFGVGVAMFALPVQKATGLNVYWLVAVAGILMSITAFIGMRALTILSFVAVPAVAVLGGFSVYRAAETIGGMQGFLRYQPAEMIGWAAALTICVGSFISGGTLTPDFARFAKNGRSGAIATVIAFFLGNSLMFLFGAIGAIATGKSDISEVMFLQGLILPAILVLGLNIWTTNDNALYASGLGFSNITKIEKKKIVVFNAIVGTVLSLWLYDNFVGWLTLLGSTLPSIGAILLADYFLINRGKYPEYEKMKFKAINWNALAAWGAGVLLAKWAPGIPPLNAILGSAAVYAVLSLIAGKITAHNRTLELEKVN